MLSFLHIGEKAGFETEFEIEASYPYDQCDYKESDGHNIKRADRVRKALRFR